MRSPSSLLVITYALLSASAAGAADDKWTPYADLGGKIGTDRSIGEANLFAPIAQNSTTLLFGDLRGRFDNHSNSEGNFGLGLRHMLDAGWNVGAYGFYDRRHTESGSRFNQATLGVEALSVDWDLRVNAYQPFGDKANTIANFGAGGAATASVVGSSIIITIPGNGQIVEYALPGFDAEAGYRLPVFGRDDTTQLRAYLGGFYFDNNHTDAVTGPRARLNLEIAEIPQLWNGARIDVGAEIQHDDVRDTQAFASLRLRIPLQDSARETRRTTLSPIERRMMDPIVRDVDIVSDQIQTGSRSTTELATADANGNALVLVDSGTYSGNQIATQLTAAGADSTVIVSGAFNTTTPITLQNGQTVNGGGTLSLKGGSNIIATLTRATGSGAVNYTGNDSAVISMADNSTLSGMQISAATNSPTMSWTVYADNTSGVSLINNIITSTGTSPETYGISAGNVHALTVRGNTISTTASSAGNYNLFVNGSSDTIFEDNILSVSGASGLNFNFGILISSNMTVAGNTLSATGPGSYNFSVDTTGFNTANSTGNVRIAGTCNDGGGNTGHISFIDNSTCP